MTPKIPKMLDPSYGMNFFQHAIQFYNAARDIRKTTKAMQAIDYLLAISYELALKAIMTARGEFDTDNHKIHNLFELFSLCNISIESKNEQELIDYLCVILTKFGRYPVLSQKDRNLLDSKLKNTMITLDDTETIARYGNAIKIINPNSGINDDTYKAIWVKLRTAYDEITQ